MFPGPPSDFSTSPAEAPIHGPLVYTWAPPTLRVSSRGPGPKYQVIPREDWSKENGCSWQVMTYSYNSYIIGIIHIWFIIDIHIHNIHIHIHISLKLILFHIHWITSPLNGSISYNILAYLTHLLTTATACKATIQKISVPAYLRGVTLGNHPSSFCGANVRLLI